MWNALLPTMPTSWHFCRLNPSKSYLFSSESMCSCKNLSLRCYSLIGKYMLKKNRSLQIMSSYMIFFGSFVEADFYSRSFASALSSSAPVWGYCMATYFEGVLANSFPDSSYIRVDCENSLLSSLRMADLFSTTFDYRPIPPKIKTSEMSPTFLLQ